MAGTFKFYTDAGLTTEFVPGTDTLGPVTDPPEDFVLYFGSTESGRQVQADSDPGTDPVQIQIADAASGSGVETTDVKLAATNGGLDSATAGAALDLAATVLSGVGNAEPIHVRVSYSGSIVNDENVSVRTVDLVETAV